MAWGCERNRVKEVKELTELKWKRVKGNTGRKGGQERKRLALVDRFNEYELYFCIFSV